MIANIWQTILSMLMLVYLVAAQIDVNFTCIPCTKTCTFKSCFKVEGDGLSQEVCGTKQCHINNPNKVVSMILASCNANYKKDSCASKVCYYPKLKVAVIEDIFLLEGAYIDNLQYSTQLFSLCDQCKSCTSAKIKTKIQINQNRKQQKFYYDGGYPPCPGEIEQASYRIAKCFKMYIDGPQPSRHFAINLNQIQKILPCYLSSWNWQDTIFCSTYTPFLDGNSIVQNWIKQKLQQKKKEVNSNTSANLIKNSTNNSTLNTNQTKNSTANQTQKQKNISTNSNPATNNTVANDTIKIKTFQTIIYLRNPRTNQSKDKSNAEWVELETNNSALKSQHESLLSLWFVIFSGIVYLTLL